VTDRNLRQVLRLLETAIENAIAVGATGVHIELSDDTGTTLLYHWDAIGPTAPEPPTTRVVM